MSKALTLEEYVRVFDRFRCPGCGYLIAAAQHWSLRCDIPCVRCGRYMMGSGFVGSLTKESREIPPKGLQ